MPGSVDIPSDYALMGGPEGVVGLDDLAAEAVLDDRNPTAEYLQVRAAGSGGAGGLLHPRTPRVRARRSPWTACATCACATAAA